MEIPLNIEEILNSVEKILGQDQSGHDMKHIQNVLKNTFEILESEPEANREVTLLTAALHDCDDYKLVGKEKAKEQQNSKNTMKELSISEEIQKEVLKNISQMGYSQYLKGIRPETLEGKIVSDADMLDAMGSSGIVRAIKYAIKTKEPIFDPEIPLKKDLDIQSYQSEGGSAIHHFFDKLFQLKDLVFTDTGKKIAQKRHDIMVEFVLSYFEENHVDQSWKDELKPYL